MSSKQPIAIVTLLLLMVIAGCTSPRSNPPGLVRDEQTISIQELATRLGLRVDEQGETFSILKGNGNTVLIFTHGGGRFFVNGKPIGAVGAVKRIAGTIHVSSTLVSQIQPHLGTAVEPPTTPLPPVTTPRAHIMIDAGHGGHDPGTISVTGMHEKHVNLAVARKLAVLLKRKGLTVTMTRQDDHYVELEDRAGMANQRRVDLYVSIHADAAPSSSAQGFTLYVAEAASLDARRLARAVSRAMATTGLDNRGVRENDYRVLVKTNSPAVLIELGYLSNRWEAARLESDAFQNRLATAISTGISDYLQEKTRKP